MTAQDAVAKITQEVRWHNFNNTARWNMYFRKGVTVNGKKVMVYKGITESEIAALAAKVIKEKSNVQDN